MWYIRCTGRETGALWLFERLHIIILYLEFTAMELYARHVQNLNRKGDQAMGIGYSYKS